MSTGFTRRQVLVSGMYAGLGLMVGGSLLAACSGSKPAAAPEGGKPATGGTNKGPVAVKMIYPRDNVPALDEGPISVALALGYFKELGIEPSFEGVVGTTDSTKLVATHKGDFSYPSPGVLATAVSNGVDIVSVYGICPRYVFGFALSEQSGVKNPKDLVGKTIGLGDGGWSVIADPFLKQLGIEPSQIKYAVVGAGRAQALATNKVDAVLTWETDWQMWAKEGIKPAVIRGFQHVNWPANSYCVARDQLQANRSAIIKYCRADAMGRYFTKLNPVATTEVLLARWPEFEQNGWDVNLAAVKAHAEINETAETGTQGWGYHDMQAWQSYFDMLAAMKILPKAVKASDFISNDLIKEINDFDHARVKKDAESYPVKHKA
ncbi:MAG TPA: ABC transporter substrate-binding protein [Symbiobacteriaceae bacterium]|nr:ABC transporter substrate-binding protein [Symbiobacteriaceae bacterium]